MIELGPLAGTKGGTVIARGSLAEMTRSKESKIAPFLAETELVRLRRTVPRRDLFRLGG